TFSRLTSPPQTVGGAYMAVFAMCASGADRGGAWGGGRYGPPAERVRRGGGARGGGDAGLGGPHWREGGCAARWRDGGAVSCGGGEGGGLAGRPAESVRPELMAAEAQQTGLHGLPPSVRVERLMATDGGESRFLNPPQVPRVPKCGTCATKRSMATPVGHW